MEIERKFTVKRLPEGLERCPKQRIEQGYLCTEPVVRVRQAGESYFLTYKGKGLMVREEQEFPLTREAYLHLRAKADGIVITKDRYRIPYGERTIELDVFDTPFAPLVIAEVEFPTEEEALAFQPPDWFERDVTGDPSYQNSSLSRGIPPGRGEE